VTYITVQGDTWDMVAFKLYSKASMLSLLIKANGQYAATAIFSAGILLKVPIEPAELPTDLPPWRR
jgi:phage tail protein X